jgi:TonB family protein
MNLRTRLLCSFMAVWLLQSRLQGQDSQAFLSPAEGTSAVNAKGARHTEASRPGVLPPWLQDRTKSVAPDYPYSERAQHHVGIGHFRMQLDLKTGVVTRITVAKSTGFQALDSCAVAALRQWRWKPGRWREVDMPVTFRLGRPAQLPPGSVRLPRT